MARYVAKNIVAAGIASECEVQLAYAIGVPEPVSVHVDDFGTGKIPYEKLVQLIRKNFDMTPKGIMQTLDTRASHIQENGGLRSLRPHGARVYVGADRQGGGTQEGRRTVTVLSIDRTGMRSAEHAGGNRPVR